MIDITKDKLLGNKLEKVVKIKRSSKIKEFIERHKALILLIASFGMLAISNGFLVYNFFRIISKL